MYSGEAFKAMPLAGSRWCRRRDGLVPSCAWMVPVGLGDAPQGWAASLAAVPHPSLLCHVPPQSAVPASAAIFTLQPESRAQMPEQPPSRLAYMQRVLTSITTTHKAPGASANDGSQRPGGVSRGAGGDVPSSALGVRPSGPRPGPVAERERPRSRAGGRETVGRGAYPSASHPLLLLLFLILLIFNFFSLSSAAHSGSPERSQHRNVPPGRGPGGRGGVGARDPQSPASPQLAGEPSHSWQQELHLLSAHPVTFSLASPSTKVFLYPASLELEGFTF